MSELDPSITLGIGNLNDPNRLMEIKQNALTLHEEERKIASGNALRQLFKNPTNFDRDGHPNQNALRAIYQIDPDMGAKMSDDMLTSQVKKAQLFHEQSESGKIKFDAYSTFAAAGYDAYQDAKTAGKSEAEANAAGMAARNATARDSGGIIGDEDVNRITSSPFDPRQAKALASTNKEWVGLQTEGERARHDEAMERNTARGQDIKIDLAANKPDPTATKWQVLTDPKNNTQYRYNPDTAESTTLDGKPYAPGGAAKIASGQARSAAALAAQRYVAEHPDATAEDIAKFAGTFQKDVAIGSGGAKADVAALTQVTKYRNMVEQFERTAEGSSKIIRELAPKGVGGTSVPIFNSWIQAGRKGTGDVDVVKFNNAIETFTTEYSKVMSGQTGGAASTDAATRKAEGLINKSQTLDQLIGALDLMQREMGVRKQSLHDQEASARADLQGESGASKPASSPPPKNLLKKGIHTTFKGGKGTWTLDENGEPVQVEP